jgi:hypothetical protein
MYFSFCKKNDKPNTILGPEWVQPTRDLGFLAWPRPKNRVQEQKLKNKDQTGSFIWNNQKHEEYFLWTQQREWNNRPDFVKQKE